MTTELKFLDTEGLQTLVKEIQSNFVSKGAGVQNAQDVIVSSQYAVLDGNQTKTIAAGDNLDKALGILAGLNASNTTVITNNSSSLRASINSNTSNIATNASNITTLTNKFNDYIPSSGGTFTGAIFAPTASSGANTTQVATTAFVTAAVAAGVTSYFAFRGSVSSAADLASKSAVVGVAYRASAAFDVAGTKITLEAGAPTTKVEIGDLFICTTAANGVVKWTIVQNNIDLANAHVLSADSATSATSATNATKVNNLTVNTAVPLNAVFTDVSVTNVSHHYKPTADATVALGATTTATGTNIVDNGVAVVTGIQRDSAGHVTGLITNTISAKGYTANKGITLNGTVFGHTYEVSSGATTSANTSSANTIEPGYAGTFTVPYVTRDAHGHVTSLGVNTVKMPNEVHNSASLVVNQGTGTSAVSASDGNVHLTLVDGGVSRSKVKIKGYDSNTTVTADGTGTITIKTKNTTYSVFTAATQQTAGSTGLVPAPGAGSNKSYLAGDGTWSAITAIADSEILKLFKPTA